MAGGAGAVGGKALLRLLKAQIPTTLVEGKPLCSQAVYDDCCQLGIILGQQTCHLHHRHLCPEPAMRLRHFQTYWPAPDHYQVFNRLLIGKYVFIGEVIDLSKPFNGWHKRG